MGKTEGYPRDVSMCTINAHVVALALVVFVFLLLIIIAGGVSSYRKSNSEKDIPEIPIHEHYGRFNVVNEFKNRITVTYLKDNKSGKEYIGMYGYGFIEIEKSEGNSKINTLEKE